jgi:hypothetical protein
MDQQMFNYISLISPDSKCLLEMPNKERRDFFYKLLDLQMFDNIRDISTKEKNKLNKNIAVYEDRIYNDQKKIENYKREINTIPSFNENIFTLEDTILENEKKIGLLNYFKKELDFLLSQQKDIEFIKDVDNISEKLITLKNMKDETNKSIQKYEKILKSGKNGICSTCEQPIDIIQIQNILKKLESKNIEYINSINELQGKLLYVEEYNKQLKIKSQILELQEKIKNIQLLDTKYSVQLLMEAKKLKERRNFLEKEINILELSIKDNTSEKEKDSKSIILLEEILDFAVNMPNNIINSIFEKIIQKVNAFFELMDKKICLNPYDIEESEILYKSSSTGERFAINLILRLSLNTLLTNILKKNHIDSLILDEGGLGNLDKNIAKEIMQILKNLIDQKILKQIIVITQQEELLEFCDVSYNVHKENNTTKIYQQ